MILPRLSIQSIQGAREETYPQNAVAVLMNRSDHAGRETIGVAGTMPVRTELFLPEIENIKPPIFSAHPQHAGPIPIN